MVNYFKTAKFFLILPVVGIAIVTTSTLFPFIVGKYVWFRASVDLALISFLLGLLFQDSGKIVLNRAKKVFSSSVAIAVTIFSAVFLIACLFAFDPIMAFWSNFERGEGGIQILHLWLFFVLSIILFREDKDWHAIFGWAIAGGVLSGIYGLLAAWNFPGFIGARFSEASFRFQGSIGNPAYVAAYAIFLMFYVAYLLSSVYRKRLKSAGAMTLFAIGAAFFGMFFLAATRGAFIGLIAAVIAFLLYVMYSRASMRKWMIAVGIAFLIIVSSFVYFKDTQFVKSIPGSRIFNITFSEKTFKDRATMWKIAIDGFKEHPILGWGPENYLSIFDRRFNTEYFIPSEGFGAWFDRAHSIYFDYLAETGILGLLSFIGIFVMFYWQFFKFARGYSIGTAIVNKAPLFERGIIFALPSAYLVQGLVLFDVYTIYINLFLFLAFSVFKFQSSVRDAGK